MNQNNIPDDEISLVDLVKTLILRKWWFLGILSLFFILTLSFAFHKHNSLSRQSPLVRYSTYFSVGYMSPKDTLEPLVSMEITIREIYAKENNSKIPLEIEHDLIKMGNLVKLNTTIPIAEDSEMFKKEVIDFHSFLLKPVIARHEHLFNVLRENNPSGLKGGYSAFTPSSILSLAQKTEYTPPVTKITPKLIVMIGLVAGFISGVLGVFLLEFILQVKKSLNENN